MKLSLIVSSILLVSICLGVTQANIWAQVASLALKQIFGLWQGGSIDIVGHTCMYKSRPSFRRFKLRHKGKVWCPGWTSFTGRSKKKSRQGAVEHAVKDFINKATASGALRDGPELRAWLQRYNG